MEKYGFVYIWYNIKNKKYYIGCHWGNENDGYICSSVRMNRSYKKYPENFKRKIISRVYTNRKDLFEEENKWLSKIKPEELGKKYYNLVNFSAHWTTDELKYFETKNKISIRTKAAMWRPEVREKYLEGIKNRPARTQEAIEKQRQSILNQSVESKQKRRNSLIKTYAKKFPIENRHKALDKNSQELKEVHRNNTKEMWSKRPEEEKKIIGEKISNSLKGQKMRLGQVNSPEHRAKISAAQKGRIFSEEHKQKLSIAAKNRKRKVHDII